MNNYNSFGTYLFDNLAVEDEYNSKRISSWDRSGNNIDFIKIDANQTVTIADIKSSGCIRHIYSTSISMDPFFYRNLLLRIYWDGEPEPSVEVPFGDFFGVGHCKPKIFNSLLLSVNPGNLLTKNREKFYTYGLNSYFPMPFSKSAYIELENKSNIPVELFWFHIDYHEYKSLDENIMKFHSVFNREKITKVNKDIINFKNISLWSKNNIGGNDNYSILETNGCGKFVGFILNVDNIAGGWWGEGDDMVFIDDDRWPPSLHGTGTEEIFGGGACPSKEYNTPYCGFHLISNEDYSRHNSMYRFFIPDPIRFKRYIKYTIEHGHANNFENDYSSIAYWFQREPHVFKIEQFKSMDRFPILNSDDEKRVIENQIKIINKMYEKKDSLTNLLNNDINKLNRILELVGIAERFYSQSKFEQALITWKDIEKTIC